MLESVAIPAELVRGPVGDLAGSGPLAVTHAVLTLDVGGMERVVLSLIRGGRSLGQEVSVLCLERPGVLAPAAEAAGAKVVALGLSGGRRRPGASRAIGEALRGLGPDVVHTHQIGALFHIGPTARRSGAPVVAHTEHGDHLSRAKAVRKARMRLVMALAARHAGRFFVVSAVISEAVAASGVVPGRKLAVVPNGIDTRAFAGDDLAAGAASVRAELGIPAGAPVVGTVGRLAEVKRQDVLIRGFAAALGRFPDARLLIVGDGPLRGELRQLAGSLGLADRAHFVGYRPHPERFLRAMDVFALTSRTEGMPLSILEAWAAGVPVVASRVGGIPGLVEHGRTGLLVDPGDPQALANALAGLLGDPSLAGRITDAARSRVSDEFGLDVMAATYEAHYRAMLAERTRTR
jgi:glycosyltransferase involved in cell wall biosynthesis